MDRASLTVDKATSDRLRAAKPAMCAAAGRMLTVGEQVAYLLSHWQYTHPAGRETAEDERDAAAAAAGAQRA